MSISTDTQAQAAAALPDEVVTQAIVRDVALPHDAGTLALITLDNGLDHTKPSTFGPRGLLELEQALDQVEARAQAGEIVAVGLTGKPFIFAVGADLGMVKTGGTREQALMVGRLGHAQFRRLGELSVPSFAYVNGAAMGGGLEIALHSTYRTISSGIPAVALPECFLGLVPGWGGTFLLPNLVGAQKALEVIIFNALNQNKMLTGPKAFELGLGDAMFEPADFLEQSLFWTSAVLRGEIVVHRTEVDRSPETWDAAVAAAKAFADLKVSGAAPAPYRALDLVAAARTADRDAAFAAEDEALADLAMGQEVRAGLYAFDLVTKRAKRPAGAPDKALARPVTTVGIVGAGLMASQFALLFVRRLKVPVIITDLDQARVDKGVGYVHAEIDKLQAKRRLSADAANRLKALVRGSTDKADFADADVVIEAVFEEMSVKKTVFAEVEAVVSDTCVLLTNTSSLSVTEMAADLKHPERVVGFHFFNPVAVLPLLEIVRGEQTDDASLATAFKVSRDLKKTSVLVKDAPAFVVNRLLTRQSTVLMQALESGSTFEETDEAALRLGIPMPPSALLALVGPRVANHTLQTLHDAFPDRFPLSPTLQALADGDFPELVARDDRPSVGEIHERILEALADEARRILDEGVVASAAELDACLILGAGFPFFRGGITKHLDQTGLSQRVSGRLLGDG